MNYINYSPYQYITVAQKGEKLSKHLLNQIKIIERFITDVLLLPKEIAERNAEITYTIVDTVVLKRINEFLFHQNSCLGCSNLKISWTADNKIICPLKKKNEN